MHRTILGLDALRFVAALLVVGYHLGFIVEAPSNPFDPLLPPSDDPLGSPPMFWYGFIGVQIFFVISGFVIAYSAEKTHAARFARDRFVRLWPSLWVCASLGLAMFLAVGEIGVASVVKRYIKEITFHPFGPWLAPVVWTLAIEITFYALVFALLVFERFRWIGGLAFCLAGISLIFHLVMTGMGCDAPVLPAACAEANENSRWLQLMLLRHGCYFAVGVALWLWLVKDIPARSLWWVSLALVACVLEIYGTVAEEQRLTAHTGFRGELLEVLPTAIWCAAVASLVAAVRFNQRLISAIGGQSARALRLVGLSTYPLYLVHYASLGFFVWVFMQAGVGMLPALLAATAGVIALSFAIVLWIEPPLQATTRSLFDATSAFVSSHMHALRSNRRK